MPAISITYQRLKLNVKIKPKVKIIELPKVKQRLKLKFAANLAKRQQIEGSQQTFTTVVGGGKSGWRQHVCLIDVDIPYVESYDG